MWMKTGRQFASVKESIPEQPVKVRQIGFGIKLCQKGHFTSACTMFGLTQSRTFILKLFTHLFSYDISEPMIMNRFI